MKIGRLSFGATSEGPPLVRRFWYWSYRFRRLGLRRWWLLRGRVWIEWREVAR